MILYLHSDILMLGNVSKNFKNMCFEIYELDPAHFPSVPEFAWQVALKKNKVKFERLTDLICC